jgi:hypothetical protein
MANLNIYIHGGSESEEGGWKSFSTCEVIFWRGISEISRGSVRLIDGEIAAFDSEKGGGR